MMTHEQLRTQFEDLTLPPDQFDHAAHVRVAWIYLREQPLVEVLRIFPERLRRYAAAIGSPGIYHETITWAFLMVIAERMEGEAATDWEAFREDNGELLRSAKTTLLRLYEEETLSSAIARERFVLPDRLRTAATEAP